MCIFGVFALSHVCVRVYSQCMPSCMTMYAAGCQRSVTAFLVHQMDGWVISRAQCCVVWMKGGVCGAAFNEQDDCYHVGPGRCVSKTLLL